VAGVGVGAGESINGSVICGLGAGAPKITGLAVCGAGVGGEDLRGAFLALGMVRVVKTGRLSGLAASAFNFCQGSVKGLSIGIVNYAWRIEKGLQIGLVNIVRDNPKGARVLPVFNTRF
jgi:hypothetical protein